MTFAFRSVFLTATPQTPLSLPSSSPLSFVCVKVLGWFAGDLCVSVNYSPCWINLKSVPGVNLAWELFSNVRGELIGRRGSWICVRQFNTGVNLAWGVHSACYTREKQSLQIQNTAKEERQQKRKWHSQRKWRLTMTCRLDLSHISTATLRHLKVSLMINQFKFSALLVCALCSAGTFCHFSDWLNFYQNLGWAPQHGSK